MKKSVAGIAAVVLVVALVCPVFAAEKMNGNIKSIDAQAGTIVFTNHEDKKDKTLSVNKSIDLGKWRIGDKVIINVEKDTITRMKIDIGGGC